VLLVGAVTRHQTAVAVLLLVLLLLLGLVLSLSRINGSQCRRVHQRIVVVDLHSLSGLAQLLVQPRLLTAHVLHAGAK
jgi:hypothetical protein